MRREGRVSRLGLWCLVLEEAVRTEAQEGKERKKINLAGHMDSVVHFKVVGNRFWKADWARIYGCNTTLTSVTD